MSNDREMKHTFVLILIFALLMPYSAFAGGKTEEYDNARMYTKGSIDTGSLPVKEIDIHWKAGDVIISKTPGYFSAETANPDVHWLYDSGKLYIRFSGSGEKESSRIVRYNLDITLPDRALDSLSLECGIGNLTLDLPPCREFELESGVGTSEVVLSSVPEEMEAEIGNGDFYITFPNNGIVRIEAPFGIGNRDIDPGIEIVKDSDIKIEMGVGNMTIKRS